MKIENIIAVISTAGGIAINFLGGRDTLISSLILLMFIDIVVGIVKSLLCKSDKSKSGALSSSSMFRGGMKKVLILVMIALGAKLDPIISPDNTYIRSAITGYYIANEALSILENIAACGIPLPKFIFGVLDMFKKNNDK